MVAVERLSGADRAWLMMDRATNRMTIVGLVIYSRPFAIGDLRTLVEERFLAHERFRCYPEADALGARWVPDVGFDIANHVLPMKLRAGADKHDLERLVGRLAGTPFRPGRPLWTFHLIENWQGGSAAIIRIHHCYADGIALSRVLLSLADGVGAAPAPEHHEDAAAHLLPFGVGSVLEKGIHYALHPLEATTAAWDAVALAGELTHLGTLTDDPPTRLKGPLSGTRRAAWLEPIPLEEVRTIGHVLGCTINDVLVSTLAGALGRYLEAHHDSVAGLTIRAAVPVDLRAADGSDSLMGNRFGLVFVELPIGIHHPLERLYAVHAAMQRLKGSRQALAVLGLMSFIGNLPSPVEEPTTALFTAKASLVASNVPGPREPLIFKGIPASQVLFWVPQAGSIGIGVSMLSYNGHVQFGVIADKQLIPRPAALTAQMASEFDRLVYQVLLGGAALTG
jgi:diacylglycerol O-acyltransferase / wax synthase